MRTVYFVIGPANTTTRFTSKLILDRGIYGSSEHVQEFQHLIDPKFLYDKFVEYCSDKSKLLVRMSYPHGYINPNVSEIIESFIDSKFDKIYVIVTSRNITATVGSNKSSFRHKYSKDLSSKQLYKQVYDNYLIAISTIWASLVNYLNYDNIKIIPHHIGDLLSNPIQIYNWLMWELDLVHSFTDDQIRSLIHFNIDIARLAQFTEEVM